MSTGRMDEPLDELILQDVYTWIDQIPLTRPKKNFARDFSDGGEITWLLEILLFGYNYLMMK